MVGIDSSSLAGDAGVALVEALRKLSHGSCLAGGRSKGWCRDKGAFAQICRFEVCNLRAEAG